MSSLMNYLVPDNG